MPEQKDEPLFAPGLQPRRRANGETTNYWVAPTKDRKGGFYPSVVRIPSGLSPVEIAAECQRHWARLSTWRGDKTAAPPTHHSFNWLVTRYETDKHSPYQRLGYRSRVNYHKTNLVITDEIGDTLINRKGIRALVAEDVWRWHEAWSERGPSVARHAITHLRILVNYSVAIGVPTAIALRGVLSAIKFPTTPARKIAPDRAVVMAIVEQAVKMNCRSIAVTTLAQFELVERRISIAGIWEGNIWRPGWVWDGIAGRARFGISKDWIVTYAQNKVGEVLRVYDLKTVPRLLELVQATPEGRRKGPVIVCEATGLPWREKHYTDTFRKIARAAGVADEICSMDMRAGGATEMDAIPGMTERDIKAAGGWASDVFNRYTRAPQRRAQNVVAMRQKAKGEG